MLVKIGFIHLATSKTIASKLKDKSFRKWIYKNKDILGNSHFDIPIILKAFKTNKDINTLQRKQNIKKEFVRKSHYESVKRVINKGEILKFAEYIESQKIGLGSYADYLTACEFLNLDMSLPKNKYPKDFKKWHDIRIDQYNAAKIEKDKAECKKFYKEFKQIADKYCSLERCQATDSYVCIIAQSPADLQYEGTILNHCVGRMNYDQKFVNEKSLIFFVRNKLAPNTPLVTLEYSLKDKKVLQCYGEHNTKPYEDVLDYINNKWLPYAKRKQRAIAN